MKKFKYYNSKNIIKENIKIFNSFKGIKLNMLKSFIIILISIIFINIICIKKLNIKAYAEPIKIGFYNYAPYYYIDREGNRRGYYYDLMLLISKELNIDYEYVDISMNESLEKLNNHEIDLLFGVGLTPERQSEYIFSKYYIAYDSMSIFTNKNIKFGELKALNNLRFGYIENSLSYNQFLQYLNQLDINIEIVKANSIDDLVILMNDDKIDFTISPSYDYNFKNFKVIYNFSSGPIYIITYKGNEDIMNKINSYFEYEFYQTNKEVEKLYNSYFNDYKKLSEKYLIMMCILLAIVLIVMIRLIYKKLKSNLKKKQILKQIQENKFIIYYQPIIDPYKNTIVACEALLRLKDKDRILTPFYFLEDIEKLDLMEEITLWELKKIIRDYEEIKSNNNYIDKEFYISLNVSFKELKSQSFVENIKKIISNVDLKKIKLCFEIVEKYQMDNKDLINKIISEVRTLGIKIAIDDFGVEYSNLDILDKIDYDIIKLDKHFIDEINTSFVRRESILFIGKVIEHYQKTMIVEGIEELKQLEALKELHQKAIYIQGYFYSPPLSLEEIKNFSIIEE